MSSSEFISQTEAAHVAGVIRRTIYNWRKRGRIKTDASGHILRSEFERVFAPHVIVSRLEQAFNDLPPRSRVPVLIEILGPEYVQAIGTIAATNKPKLIEGDGQMRNVK